MKRCIKNLFVLPVMMAALGSMLPVRMVAQTFTILYSFTTGSGSFPNITNNDGAGPAAGLMLSGSTLYGTTYQGGTSGKGTVFKVNSDGSGFTNLHSFTAGSGSFPNTTNSDGANPSPTLILLGNTLYGTARNGGSSGKGTVFALSSDGIGFTNLYSFTGGSDGANPFAGLILSGSTLYGTTVNGGSGGSGTVFAINTDGTGFTNLHIFTATSGSATPNSDGANPFGRLILSGTILYGTTYQGGSSGYGTLFAVGTDGTGFTNLHHFSAIAAPYYTNSDGAYPVGGLVLSNNTLYGMADLGGSGNSGTVFKLNSDGSGFTNLHSFTATSGPFTPNSDGSNPRAGLALSGNTLYGTAYDGGSSGNGTLFEVSTDGSGFMRLYSFSALNNSTNEDGANPAADLILSGKTLYGSAYQGGSSGHGTLFSLSLQPDLTLISSGANVILTWPSNAIAFSLQSTTDLVSGVWTTNFPAPVILNGQYVITNPISGAQQFFRLSK